jgi:hypothetical protein
MATIYETKDGQQFKYEGDAQTHANNLAEREAALEASANKALDSFDKALKEWYAYVEPMRQYRTNGENCEKREDWRGAVKEYTKAINFMTDAQWEEYKQNFLNSNCAKTGGTKNIEIWFHHCKKQLVSLYRFRGLAKMKVDPLLGGARDVKIGDKLNEEILEAEKQNPYLKE